MKTPRPTISFRALLVLPWVILGLWAIPTTSPGEQDLATPIAPPQTLRLKVDQGILELRPLLPNAVRVRFTRDESPEQPSYVLSETVAQPVFHLEESPESVSVKLEKLHVTVERSTGAITFSSPDGRVLLKELPGTRVLERSTVQGEPTWSVSQSFDSPLSERIYGTGQFQDGFLNLRNLPRRLTQVNTQIAIPMIVSSRGFGLLWHNYGLTEFNEADQPVPLAVADIASAETSVAVTTTTGTRHESRRETVFEGSLTVTQGGLHAFFLDVGQKMARQWNVEIDGKPVLDFANVWLPPTTSWFCELTEGTHAVRVKGVHGDQPTLRFRPAGNSTRFHSPVAAALDYVVFAGRGDEVIASFRKLTGPAPLPPVWALGYIHCRERYKTQEELLQNAAEFRSRHLPLDLIVQDWQYWGHHGWNAMRFDERAYPDPATMVSQLHQQNTRLMVSVWSKIDPKSELGHTFESRGYFIPGTDWVDFFNPAAADFYWQNFRSLLLPLGIDAWWLDATEPENDDLAGRRVHLGAGERLRNIYPLFVNKTVYEGLRHDDPTRRAFILTRCAFAGQQRYGSAVWSGDIGNDWETLRRQLTAGLNLSVTGLPWWTTDTGGFFRPGAGQFSDSDYHERFLRWFQYSTFTPLLRLHGYQTDTEPWRYGEFVERETRRWLEFRYRLLPYLYSEAARVSLEGSTLMRPLVLDFPDDEAALNQSYEFMFGPALLVSPVLKPGVTHWPVYLPRNNGGWFDFWTGENVSGAGNREVEAPLERIPLHVRAGSILPLGPRAESTSAVPAEPLELRIYPGADAHFTLYEDDGLSYAYEKGERATIEFNWDDHRRTLSIGTRHGSFPTMQNKQVFHLTWVRPGHGVGLLPETHPDLQVTYSGLPLTIVQPR